MLATIERSVQYSNKIVNDLLEYSRDIKLEVEKTNPKIMIDNVIAMVDNPENVTIMNLVKDAPDLQVDASKIGRVFVNIVTNAIDAMPNGGTLTISSRETDGRVEISFRDTGTGMNQETISRLWTPLFTTKAKGMGFGLAICKRIVEAHGGTINVESTLNKGTTFKVSLPLNVQTTFKDHK
jgi:signal transduction histidine kinase